MKLFYRKIGAGRPLIILHGLFGQSDNWNTLGKLFSEHGFEVYLVDLRNHGNSPHSDEWDYQTMSDDVFELISDLNLEHKKIILLGHSMGGKVAMKFTIQYPEIIDRLVVVDISPKYHLPDNQLILNALNAIDLKRMKTRKEVDVVLSEYILDVGVRQFLLKNIYWKEEDETSNTATLEWKFNFKALIRQIEKVNEPISVDTPCTVPALFIRGAQSNYVLDEDVDLIQKTFSESKIESISGAGHWVHADKPTAFFNSVISFIK